MNERPDHISPIYTVGHSNRPLDEFVTLLTIHGIKSLVDIRTLPGSRTYPHFDKESLEKALPEHSISYMWMPRLGGLRRSKKGFDSPNTGLTSPAFRAYADYMAEEEFLVGVAELLAVAARATTSVMCAEAVYWRCHRRLLSDYLVAQGIEVLHILGPKSVRVHKLSEGAIVAEGNGVRYPPLPV